MQILFVLVVYYVQFRSQFADDLAQVSLVRNGQSSGDLVLGFVAGTLVERGQHAGEAER